MYSAADKAMALLHSIALEAGRTEKALRSWVDSVRVALPDGGAEHICVDAPDVVPYFLSQPAPDAAVEIEIDSYLFKYALYLPEMNHIFDGMSCKVLNAIDWFDEWFSAFRVAVGWLRERGHVVKIRIILEHKGHFCLSKKISGPTNPFKLRWGTVCWSTLDVLGMKDGLIEALDPLFFETSRVESRTTFDCIHSQDFWKKCSTVHDIARLPEEERGWSRGCPCHEQECRDGARKGVPFRCPNNLKSMRAPYLRKRIHEHRRRWAAMQRDLRQDHLDDPNGVFFSTKHKAYGQLEGLSLTKLNWIELPQYRIWEARTDEIARQWCLQRYEEDKANGVAHRVSCYLHDSEGELGQQWA